MPAASTTLVVMNNNNSNSKSTADSNNGDGTMLRRRTVNNSVDDEAGNDWEAVSDIEASLSEQPLLTLMEQVVLLGLKDKQVLTLCYVICLGIFELYE